MKISAYAINKDDRVFYWKILEAGDNPLITDKAHGLAVNCGGTLEKVEYVHSGSPPLLNLANGDTSAPHHSYVPTATHGFYTISHDINEVIMPDS